MLKEYSVHTVTYIHSTWCGGVVVTSCEIYISKLYNLIMRLCAAAVWCCIQYWCVQSLTANPELSLCPIYTIQPVVKLVWQPVECSYTRYSWLSNRFDNRFHNRVERTDCSFNTVVKPVVQPGLTTVLNEQPLFIKPVVKLGCTTGLTTGCIHDTAVCETGWQTGFTASWMFVYRIQPVVKPVWQLVVSCIQTFTRLSNRLATGLTTCCIV